MLPESSKNLNTPLLRAVKLKLVQCEINKPSIPLIPPYLL